MSNRRYYENTAHSLPPTVTRDCTLAPSTIGSVTLKSPGVKPPAFARTEFQRVSPGIVGPHPVSHPIDLRPMPVSRQPLVERRCLARGASTDALRRLTRQQPNLPAVSRRSVAPFSRFLENPTQSEFRRASRV